MPGGDGGMGGMDFDLSRPGHGLVDNGQRATPVSGVARCC